MECVKLIENSVAPSGVRLVTFEIRLPKCLLAEFNTHRAISKNAASSRAIPAERVMDQILNDPYIPVFGKNQKGMQSYTPLSDEEQELAKGLWLEARDEAIDFVQCLTTKSWKKSPAGEWIRENEWGYSRDEMSDPINLLCHKQDVNRILEPWMYAEIVATGTDWINLFWLRNHKCAHPAFREVARQAETLYWSNPPNPVREGGMHAPYLMSDERGLSIEEKVARSVPRCAGASYGRAGRYKDLESERNLYERLRVPDPEDPMSPVHASPFEHQAIAGRDAGLRSGNFRGWTQARKLILEVDAAPEPIWSYNEPGAFNVPKEWEGFFNDRTSIYGTNLSVWMDRGVR